MTIDEFMYICQNSKSIMKAVSDYENTGHCENQEEIVQHIKKYWHLFNQKKHLYARLTNQKHLDKCIMDNKGNVYTGTEEAGCTLADVDGVKYKFFQSSYQKEENRKKPDLPYLRDYVFEDIKFKNIMSIKRYIERKYAPPGNCYDTLKICVRTGETKLWHGILLDVK